MDEVLLGKAAIIERCLKRIDEMYPGHEQDLASDFMRQDAVLLNLQRACEAAIDAAMHLVRIRRLGIPTDSRQAFTLLTNASVISAELGRHLAGMVGFRNVLVHNYRELDINVMRSILDHRLEDLSSFAQRLIALALPEQGP
jgi:uncharacterized protein YutE (UPF0331/DUF86 family)